MSFRSHRHPAPTTFSRETTETWSVHLRVTRGGNGPGNFKRKETGSLVSLREKADVMQVASTKITKYESVHEEIP